MRREAANDVGKMKSKSQIERNKCKKWLDKPMYNNNNNNISNNYNKNNYNTRHQQQQQQQHTVSRKVNVRLVNRLADKKRNHVQKIRNPNVGDLWVRQSKLLCPCPESVWMK